MKEDVEIRVESPEYKTVDEKNWENHINGINERYDMIKTLLFKDGGYPQALMYLAGLFKDHFNMGDILKEIGDMYENTKSNLENNSVISVSRFLTGKEGYPYACLDKDLKFCVRHYGQKEWEDVLYVFPYMNTNKAYDVSFKYDI